MSHSQLVQFFAEHFIAGQSFSTIVAARRQAEWVLRQKVVPGTAFAKQVDEAVEAAVVRAARRIVATSTTTHEAYERLVNLQARQPSLNVRSSTSVLQQAYSTPIPIAYLASTLAKIDAEQTVYEPTAGHGALLIASNPLNVTVNEINPERAAELRDQGYTVTEYDAAEYQPGKLHDRVICNPPFGRVRDPTTAQRQLKRFSIPGSPRPTTRLDQAIAFRALESMKEDGQAVLILGGKLSDDAPNRSDRYHTLESRNFYAALYSQYRVTQHFSIWGNLYRKQGAGFPIDVLVITGRGQSERPLPAALVPPIYRSFAELQELIPYESLCHLSPSLATATELGAVDDSSSVRPGSAEPTQLQKIIVRTDRVADSTGVESLRGESSSNSTSVSAGTEPPAFVPRASSPSRARSALDMDERLGRDVRRAQRGADAEASRRFSDFDWPLESPMGATGDRSARRDHVGALAVPPERGFHKPLRLLSPHAATHFNRNGRETVANSIPSHQPLIATAAPTFDVPYRPRSRGRTAANLIPTNMADAAQKALERLEHSVGDIDAFVQQRLGYESQNQMWRFLYAEQIDAIALAFYQRDQGNIFLNGDKTGNGKGRFGAANLVDASRQGYIPVFVTQKANLYNSMLADLADIGKPGFRIFATDHHLTLDLDDGRKLRTGDAPAQEAEMRRILQQGLQSYDAIFTTYSQLQTVKQQEPFRRLFFRGLAPRSVFIFDESHEAGGTPDQVEEHSQYPNRAEFVRTLVDRSAGAVFMSATAIKNAGVIDLYARRSDARYAVENLNSLESLLKQGGVPLQQMFATKFVASGQMLRRSRSMAGISFAAQVVAVDREVAEDLSAIMRAINEFDEAKQPGLEKLKQQLKAEAKVLSEDGTTGAAGARSVNFTSLMHNAIDQSLLAQKAEMAVQAAIAAIERGEKPLIGVANTMESFIAGYTEENGIQPGEPLSITFGDVLERYLERSRDVIESNCWGHKTRRRLTDEEIGAEGMAAFEASRDLIHQTDLSSIPLSSIDYIRWRLTQSGYRVDEITGRNHIIEYSQGGETSYGLRPGHETSPQARINIINRFNRGDLDVVILNRSGATGINLHASEKFADQRPRRLIVAQAERDINLVMQLFGRIDRYGQVVKPSFDLLMSDLPAEKRLGALLAKKMTELNANVTASPDSDLSVPQAVDFMNVYGEEVVREVLQEDYELQAKLGFPLDVGSDTSEIAVIKRVTGRIPLLSILDQEELYDLIESETRDLIAQKEVMGESVLRADQLDLQARTLARMEVIPDESGVVSEFTGPVCLEVVDANVPIKPLTQLQVINTVREGLGLPAVREVSEHDFEATSQIARARADEAIATLQQETEVYRRQMMLHQKTPTAREKLNEKLDTQLQHVTQWMRETPPGTAVRVVSSEGNTFYGVVARISQTGQSGSPAAPTHWKAQILVDHRSKQLIIPLSKLNRGKDEAKTLVSTQLTNGDGEDIYRAFDLRQTQHQRTQMQIFTGNPLKAYEKYPKGKFLNYTNAQGAVAQGLIMPVGFDIEESLQAEPVVFQDPQQVKVFLTDVTQRQGSLKTLDELLTIRTQGSGLILQTPKSSIGNRFVLDSDLMSAADSEFYSVGDRMELQVPADRIDSVLSVIMQQKQWSLAAFDWKKHARDYLGMPLPELRRIESRTLDPPMVAEPSFVVPAIAPTASATFRIAPAKEQSGRAERNTAQFLEQAGLASAVMADFDFYLQVENPPYIPLVIERHDAALHLIHWLEDSQGDLFIDTEMIFHLSEAGHLTLQETAVQNPLLGGELRRHDRGFAQLFSRNLLQQGFPEAVRRLQSQETLAQPEEMLPSQPVTESEDPKAMIPPQSAVLSPVDFVPEVVSTPVEVESPIHQTAESDIALLRFGGHNSVQLEPDELQAIHLAFSYHLAIQSESELRIQLSEIIEPAVGRRNIVAAVNALMAQCQQYVGLELPKPEVVTIANSLPFGLAESSTLAIDQEIEPNHAEVQLDFKADPTANSSRLVADPPQPTKLVVEGKLEVQSQTPSARVITSELAASSQTLSEESFALFDVELYSALEGDYQTDAQGYDPTWEIVVPMTPVLRENSPTERSLAYSETQVELISDVTPDTESAAQPKPDHQAVFSDLSCPAAESEFPHSKLDVTDWVAIANEVRHFDLETVANHLGLVKDRHDKSKWKGAGHIISINHDKFYDWLADRGSKGAIDLVMLVQNCDFKAAVHWLSGQSLTSVNVSQSEIPVRLKVRALELPQADERHWEGVQRYLVEVRGLPAKLIHRLHAQGLVYADEHCNAVFLRYASDADGQTWVRHQPTGALLRGTRDPLHPFHRLAPGSSRDHGWFWIAMGHGVVQRVLLTESPIDALSLATLETDKRSQIPGITIYLSTDGAGAIPLKPLQTVIEQGGEVIAAFDADHAGEKMAWRVAQQLRGVRRMAPAYGKDWNERLLGGQQPQDRKPAVSARGDKQTLHSLWQWYRVATELGHPQNYLTRISEVAREVVEDHPLSQKARSAMRQDFQTYQQRIALEPQSGNRTSAPDTSLRATSKKQRLEVEVGS